MRISLAEGLPENISGGGFTREYLWRRAYLRISLAEGFYENISGGGFT